MLRLSSPNYAPRKKEHALSFLVLHYTVLDDLRTVSHLCDPLTKVSAHYVVSSQVKMLQLVAEEQVAWHAGESQWKGFSSLNQYSVGIEVVNTSIPSSPGMPPLHMPFHPQQVSALIGLCRSILSRYPAITPWNILGHSDIAPYRKEDPGPLFPWKSLAKAGIGWYPDLPLLLEPPLPLLQQQRCPSLRSRLKRIGYGIPEENTLEEENIAKCIYAFTSHYCGAYATRHWHTLAEMALTQLETAQFCPTEATSK